MSIVLFLIFQRIDFLKLSSKKKNISRIKSHAFPNFSKLLDDVGGACPAVVIVTEVGAIRATKEGALLLRLFQKQANDYRPGGSRPWRPGLV